MKIIQKLETLNAICREAKTAGKLSGTNLTELYELFGSDSLKALMRLKKVELKNIFLSQVEESYG